LEMGATDSTLTVWGQDASWMMNLTEQAHEWSAMTDATVANTIFGNYGITPAPENTDDDSASHVDSGHTLMQRASDIQFLRTLARRSGKHCRVACAQQAGQRTGYFVKPKLDGDATVTLSLNGTDPATATSLDFAWDVARPTAIAASQASFSDPTPEGFK